MSFEDLVADKQRRESELSYNEAVDEVVADACEMMLKDSTAVEQLANENRSLDRRIADWLRKWPAHIRRQKANTGQQRRLRGILGKIANSYLLTKKEPLRFFGLWAS